MDNDNKKKPLLWILIKLKILEMLRGNSKKKGGKGKMIGGAVLGVLYVISFVFIGASIGALFYLIGTVSAIGSLKWLYFSYMAIFVFLLCFIGTVFLTETQMFEAKDNERLIAMPISPWYILISRMVSLLVLNFVFSAVVSIPAGVVFIIINGFDIIWFLFYLIGIILVPLFALSFSMLGGWGLSLLTRRVKNTRFIKLAIAVVAMLLYFYFVMSGDGWVNTLVDNGRKVAEGIKSYIPPMYSVGKALGETDVLHFLLMIAWCVIPFLLVSFLVSRNFLNMITSGEGQVKFNYKSTGVKVRSPFMSMAKLEMDRFLSSVTYMMNGGTGLLLMLLMAFFSLSSKESIGSLIMGLSMVTKNSGTLVGSFMCVAILGVMGMVCISAATISLEANTLWIPKSIPARGSDVILSKAFPHVIISIPFILLTAIVVQLNLDISLIDRILIIIIPLTANIFNGILGVRINARFPKFNWTNEAQAVKQGVSVLLVMILGVIPAIVFLLGIIFLVIQSRVSIRGLLVLMECIYIALSLWMFIWAKKKGDHVIASLEN